MAYSTQTDILKQIEEDLLIQLTDDNETGSVDAAIVTQGIADADAEIDSYLATKYTVPLTTVPDLVLKFSVDIAIYNLYSRRGTDDEVRTRNYKDAVKQLEAFVAGKATLGITPPPDETQAGPETSSDEQDRIFTRGKKSDSSSGTLDNY